MQTRGKTTISLQDIVRHVNTVDPDSQLVVIRHPTVPSTQGLFPLRTDAFMMVLVEEGSGMVDIDMEQYELREGSLFVLQPRNYINSFECVAGTCSTVLACSMNIMESVLPSVTDVLPFILSGRTSPVLQLTGTQSATVHAFLKYIKERLEGPRTRFLQGKIIGALQALFYEVLDIRIAGVGMEMKNSRKEELLTNFLISVSKNFKEHRDLSFYAGELCVSVKYMSALVREVSGLTPGDWIERYVIMEAKRLLRTTNLSIQEIAGQMNFANQSFFGKYFRKITGMSPRQFRSSGGMRSGVESPDTEKATPDGQP